MATAIIENKGAGDYQNTTKDVEEHFKSEKIKGKYNMPWEDFHLLSASDLFKVGKDYVFGLAKDSRPKQDDPLDELLPVKSLNTELLGKDVTNGVQVTWLGHSSMIVQMHSLTILVDPVFSDRCSPSPISGPARYRHVPGVDGSQARKSWGSTDVSSVVENLGLNNIDVVIISHNHYDHLDKAAVKALSKQYKKIKWFVPAGVDEWLRDQITVQHEYIKGFQWWKTEKVGHAEFMFVPAKHWSGRGAFDRYKTLWGGWCIGSGTHSSFFYPGDTGYCKKLFKMFGEKYGPFDCAAIPIGAYIPRQMMQCQHVDPGEAVKIHEDVKSNSSVGIHWGTFCLGYEHYLDPREDLKRAMKREENEGTMTPFITMAHGETLMFPLSPGYTHTSSKKKKVPTATLR